MSEPIDESLLTAYALGELTGTERTDVAAYLAGNVEARQYVAEIRATASLLIDELTRESFGGLTDLQHAAIEQKLDSALSLPPASLPMAQLRIKRQARWDRAVVVMSLAASLLIVFGVISILMPFVYERMRIAMQEQPSQPDATPNPAPIKMPSLPPMADSKLPGRDLPDAVGSGREHMAIAEDERSRPEDQFTPQTPQTPPPDDRIAASGTGREGLPFTSPLFVPPHRPDVRPALPIPLTRIPPGSKDPSYAANPGTAPGPHASDNFASKPLKEEYTHLLENPFIDTATEPVSGFSAAVDTASYSNIRRYLAHGKLPPKDAVRIEEMLNYFPVRSMGSSDPLALQVESGACPWKPEHRLVRVCLQARDLPPVARPPVNLVFVIDISDTMRSEKTKLPLVKQAMHLLIGKLTPRDRVSVIAYSTEAGIVLPPTAADDKTALWAAVDRLEGGGQTSGGQGIEVAYDLAKRMFMHDGVNRIILATDGNWTVGATAKNELASIIHDHSRENISLTVLGVGMKDLKDGFLQRIATAGNGSYAYIDTIEEAKKVLLDQASGALVAAARDVKVQIKFNSASARSYRLIGYERRALSKAELNSQSKPGGELGAGQSVTALYEVDMAGKPTTRPTDLLSATVTYADPMTMARRSLTSNLEDRATPLPRMSTEFRFAAAVAEFGLLLRDSDYKGNATYSSVLDQLQQAAGPDETGYRTELAKLIRRAKALTPPR